MVLIFLPVNIVMPAGIKRRQKQKETKQSDGSYLKCRNNPTAWNMNKRKLGKKQKKSDGTKRRRYRGVAA